MTKYEVKPEWNRQALVVNGGLIAIGVVILQPLIAAPALDLPSLVAIIAFAIALPLLATIVLLIHYQSTHKYATYPWYLTLVIILGQSGAFIGVVAAFWHISWIAGTLLLISGAFGLVIYAVYSRQIERDNRS